MDKELDALLEEGLLSVPGDFVERVMREVRTSPLPVRPRRWRERLQWLALIGSGILGVMELSGFVFGMWTTTNAF